MITMGVVSCLESRGGGHGGGGFHGGGGRSFGGGRHYSGYGHGGGGRRWGNQNYYGRRGYGYGGAFLGAELGVIGAEAALGDDYYDEDPGYYDVIDEEGYW